MKLLLSISLLRTLCAAIQPSAPRALEAPIRDLQWGQLNFLHTTDIHGWFAGHLNEPSYSADWGDYVSFVHWMRQKAESQGQDLLVIDTGDRVEGNGLYDASTPKGIYTSEILSRMEFDVITTGNHELYKQETSDVEFNLTVPRYRGSYLASNLKMIDPSTGKLIPFAAPFKKFTTKAQGTRVMAFGFIFDFHKNANNTIVQDLEDCVNEDWFQEAIQQSDIDLFLITGHLPVNDAKTIVREIRRYQDTPVQIFGGHLHVRDFTIYDSSSTGLASGRFMETVGFLSIDGLSNGTHEAKLKEPQFHRRYIDNNLFSFYHHTGLNETTFPTELGQNTSNLIAASRHALSLDYVYGCAPKSLWMDRVEYPSDDNIYTWLEDVIRFSFKRKSHKNPIFALVNTGSLRFDIFRGPFTKDNAFIISPFTSGFRILPGVPYSKAKQIMVILNRKSASGDMYDAKDTLRRMSLPRNQQVLSSKEPVIRPGHMTIDAGGADGDDTIHSPVPLYPIPKCLGTLISPDGITPTRVDLVYVDFIESKIAAAAKEIRLGVDVLRASSTYLPSTAISDLIIDWVQNNWSCDQG
ncbi:uncharacterized protein N7443_007211 [Penicillium atrosanguineum]|uniref:Metallo-dependent phosphatase-like protein n=1 Tax=Penicillium atrosanguineum TaxID=1132637 RepID=A0A9W9TYR4_9EURO|nr:uncharacterized protein N7443_007211 [Penicillium atrosanguineum]KAJ5118281.1 Metallo-dependent phosphatase-like protein [Penicillium atrosanguineum]KAJ5296318.1 hypothetical protein N7443_007211 [Penicillium atrosanguineum]KAJ5299087.1 Metallo-dependent phosphatase-like protein [Penicillium atrosanguineum]